MFDTYRINPSVHVSASVRADVHEHRAPTDDSIRLLREMESKARQEVINTIRVQNTTFDGVIHQMRRPLDMTTVYRCIFKLNGTRLSADYVANERDDMETRIIGIRDAIATEIANNILTPIIKDIRE